MGRKSKEEFKRKLAAIKKMDAFTLGQELAATEKSLGEIRDQKKQGAKVLSKGRLHNLRIYKRALMDQIIGRDFNEQ